MEAKKKPFMHEKNPYMHPHKSDPYDSYKLLYGDNEGLNTKYQDLNKKYQDLTTILGGEGAIALVVEGKGVGEFQEELNKVVKQIHENIF